MANVNLSLDDIIKTKKNSRVGGGGGARRSGGGGGGGGGGVRRSAGGGGGRAGTSRRTGGREKYFSDDVPSGKWKHDKYFEAYGSGNKRRSGGGGAVGGASGGARRSRGGAEMVKLNISNLPDTVLTEDLEELFQDFQVFGVAVHYDESGAHLGTATLFVSPTTAKSVIREYANIAIDGQEIKIGIVDESGALARGGRIADRIHRVGGGGGGSPVRRRNGGGGGGGGGRRSAGGRVTKPGGGGGKGKPTLKKMTVEELDKELESYMGNRQGKE